MSSASRSASRNLSLAKPRIILEQQADGTLVIESYTNGQRGRTAVLAGTELASIYEALARQERQLEMRRELYRASHSDNIELPTGPIPEGYTTARSADSIADLERVCHCGELVRPFMDKCTDCPGHAGAGKVKRSEERSEARNAAQHRKVWLSVAYGTDGRRGHGENFANKTVGKLRGTPKVSEPALAVATVDML